MIQRYADNVAARRTFFGDEVEGLVLTKDGLRNVVGKLSELRPFALGRQKEMFKLAAVSIGNGG